MSILESLSEPNVCLSKMHGSSWEILETIGSGSLSLAGINSKISSRLQYNSLCTILWRFKICYGLVEQSDELGLWSLTSRGREYLKIHLEDIARRSPSQQDNKQSPLFPAETQRNPRKNRTRGRFSSPWCNCSEFAESGRLSLYFRTWIDVTRPSEEEVNLVELIGLYYLDTGQKKISFERWPDDLMEKCRIADPKRLKKALASLQEKRCVFLKYNLSWQAELYSDFVNYLHRCWHESEKNVLSALTSQI